MSGNPKLFVTGATGQLGGHVIDTLLETVPPGAIVAGVRDTAQDAAPVSALRGKGIETRPADDTRPDQRAAAFEGIDQRLLVSSSENGKRKRQHRTVIDAAKAAGVGQIAYPPAREARLRRIDPHRQPRDAYRCDRRHRG